jgi:hypothetical protein
MTPDQLANLADYLAHEWNLSEVELEDLLALGTTIAMCENDGATVRAHMEIRAEVLSIVGSDMEEWTREFKRIYGKGI